MRHYGGRGDFSFHTGDVPESQRTAAWADALRDAYYGLEVSPAVSPNWRAGIEVVNTADSRISRFRSSPSRGFRPRRFIKDDPDEYYALILVTKGTMYYCQSGRNGLITAGQYFLVRSGEPYEISCSEECRNLTVRIPVDRVEAHYRLAGNHCACAFENFDALSPMLASTLDHVFDLSDETRSRLGLSLDRQIIDFIVMLLCAERDKTCDESSPASRDLMTRIIAHLEECYSDPDLAPAVVADWAGISIGYLHRVFNVHGKRFGTELRDIRLARAYETLAFPGGDKKRIGDLAFECGFQDHAYFSRIFRENYGLLPSEVRKKRF